jgi:MoaD family protein
VDKSVPSLGQERRHYNFSFKSWINLLPCLIFMYAWMPGTMRVHVKYFSALRDITSVKEEDLEVDDACTVMTLLRAIAGKYGEKSARYLFDPGTNAPRPYLQYMVENSPISGSEGFATKLRSGCTVSIIPPVGGG